MTTHPCGCTTERHEPTGALRSVVKCPNHKAGQRDPATLDERYYREMGALDADAPERYVRELTEALGEIPLAPLAPLPTAMLGVSKAAASALEIGCGFSPYAKAIRAKGYDYYGVELSSWACDSMRSHFPRASLLQTDFETMGIRKLSWGFHFEFILATHSFEHMTDAPAAIAKAASLLSPGGELWIVVPDDSDLFNPDHIWFFTEASLRKAVEMAWLKVKRLVSRRIVERENFLYLRAVKL